MLESRQQRRAEQAAMGRNGDLCAGRAGPYRAGGGGGVRVAEPLEEPPGNALDEPTSQRSNEAITATSSSMLVGLTRYSTTCRSRQCWMSEKLSEPVMTMIEMSLKRSCERSRARKSRPSS